MMAVVLFVALAQTVEPDEPPDAIAGAVEQDNVPDLTLRPTEENSFPPEQPNKRSHLWDPNFRRFQLADYLSTAAAAGALLGLEHWDVHSRELTLGGRNFIDGPVTDFFSLGSVRARDNAAKISDRILYWSQFYPYLIDGIIVPLAVHRDPVAAWQMTMMNVQAFAASTLFVRLSHRFIHRARPAMEHCARDPGYYYGCATPDALGNYSGFLSGHVSVVMTGAGLICAHHAHMPLYGGGVADKIPCIGMIALGTIQGTLRLMADKHYFSDVLLGASVGLLAGYGMPSWLHYEWNPLPQTKIHMALLPQVSDTTIGLQIVGME